MTFSEQLFFSHPFLLLVVNRTLYIPKVQAFNLNPTNIQDIKQCSIEFHIGGIISSTRFDHIMFIHRNHRYGFLNGVALR